MTTIQSEQIKFDAVAYYSLIRIFGFMTAFIFSLVLSKHAYLLLPTLLYPIVIFIFQNQKFYIKLFVWAISVFTILLITILLLPENSHWTFYIMPIVFGQSYGMFLGALNQIEKQAGLFIPKWQLFYSILFYIFGFVISLLISNFSFNNSLIIYLTFIIQPLTALVVSKFGKFNEGLNKAHGGQIDNSLLFLGGMNVILGGIVLFASTWQENYSDKMLMIVIGAALFASGVWLANLFLGHKFEESLKIPQNTKAI